jgi:hypothetical protein
LQGCFEEDAVGSDNDIMQHGAHTYMFTMEAAKDKGKGGKKAGIVGGQGKNVGKKASAPNRGNVSQMPQADDD